MENFVHDIPTELRFGKDVISGLPEVLKRYGRNVLLVYGGGSIRKIRLYERIMELLKDFNVIECDGIEPNPRIESVEKGSLLCKENDIDVVLAAGGGSTIDAAKAICVGAYYEGVDYWQIVVEKGGEA